MVLQLPRVSILKEFSVNTIQNKRNTIDFLQNGIVVYIMQALFFRLRF